MKIRWHVWVYIGTSAVLLLASLGLISFFSSLEQLSSFGASFIPMAPLSAFCFFAIALPFFLLVKSTLKKWELFLILMLTITVIIISSFGLAGNIFNKNVNIEDYIIVGDKYSNGIPLFRMSSLTKILFLLSSVDLMTFAICNGFGYKTRYVEFITGVLTLFVFVSSYVFCISYLYGKSLLYDIFGVIPMAISTTLAFVFFALTMLIVKHEQFPISFLFAKNTRGILLRFILPLVLLPVLLIQAALLFTFTKVSPEPFFITTSLILFIALISGWIAVFISKYLNEIINLQSMKLVESEKILKRSEEKYRTLFESMIQGVVYQNSSGVIIDANQAACKIFGLSTDQLIGRTTFDDRWKMIDQKGDTLPGEKHPAIVALRSGKEVANFIMGVFNIEINRFVWLTVTAIPKVVLTSEGEDLQVFTIFMDISELITANDENKTLRNNLEMQVELKTRELNLKIAELEKFYDATIDRELRMEELRKELEMLKKQIAL